MKLQFRETVNYNIPKPNFKKSDNIITSNIKANNYTYFPFTNYINFKKESISFKGNNKDMKIASAFSRIFEKNNNQEISDYVYTIAESPVLFLSSIPKEEKKEIYRILDDNLTNNNTLTEEICSDIKDIMRFIKHDIQEVKSINEKKKTIDISSKGEYPSNVLSNFYKEKNPFYVDNIPCFSMEGFLQSLKVEDIEEQKQICLKNGIEAKNYGKKYTKSWQNSQILYWQGKPYKRESNEYFNLIRKAFKSRLNSSDDYKAALKASDGYRIMHNCGFNDKTKSILTSDEFIQITNEMRNII